MQRIICHAVLTFSVFFVLSVSSSTTQAQSSWDSLPEETVGALRIPDGQAFVEALRETKFGAVMLSDQRKAAITKVLESSGSGEWSEFQTQLKEYGLTTDDLLGLLAGESGYAVVMMEAEEPMFAGLGWLEPGEELASKFFELLAKVIEEQDDEHPTMRIDLTLADLPVMQLQVPSISFEYDDDYDLSDDYSELSDEEQEEALDIAVQKWEESAVEVISYNTVLVAQLGDRLLVAHSYQAEDEETVATTSEQLSVLFGQWIAAHATGSAGFAPRLTDEPGAARVMALEGLPVFELLGDVAPLVKLLRASAPSGEKAEQIVRIIGLDGLGSFAMRSTVEGAEWRTQMSLAVPAPRQGLMQLLDQQPLAIDPPQWVPASTVEYTQWSFDLGKAYEIIKETVLREFPDRASAGYAMVEMQVQNFAQASLPEVLSSLGNRHILMSFGLESGESDGEVANSKVSERMAMVWQVEDEDLWGRLLKAITPLAGMAPGTEFSEEQGFSGWRMKKSELEGGLFLGKGYLVLGYGSGVLESVLSTLNNPPTGADALRGSAVFAKAGAMIDLEPALAVQITDGGRYLSMALNAINRQLEQADKLADRIDDEDDEVSGLKLMLSLAHAVMPSPDEIKGMVGVIVSRWEVNDDGVFGSSVQEMPGQ
ncbi:MAG: hypothetical protein GXP24_04040 [Planctomycetes bacterium]|nr:hypothetical protein [Planctomycetota bacterium]